MLFWPCYVEVWSWPADASHQDATVTFCRTSLLPPHACRACSTPVVTNLGPMALSLSFTPIDLPQPVNPGLVSFRSASMNTNGRLLLMVSKSAPRRPKAPEISRVFACQRAPLVGIAACYLPDLPTCMSGQSGPLSSYLVSATCTCTHYTPAV